MLTKTLLSAASLLPLLFSTASAQTACNNSPSLCNRPYNNITYLGAHDSPFLRDESTSFSTSGNQYYDSTVQLDAGVRLLSAQVHRQNNTSGDEAWHLCHSSCDLLDAGTLSSWLSNISNWMDSNPNEVVTVLIVNSDDASASDLGAQFVSSGASKHAYTPPSPSTIPQTWPTLQSLISNRTRLITFVASLSDPDPNFPYLLDEFTFVFENPFENTSPQNFSCTPDRPSDLATPQQAAQSGRMFLMNHFLYSEQLFGIQTPDVDSLDTTNAQTGAGSLGNAVQTCTGTYGKAPNFVLVDFFNVGPAIASVDAANGVQGPVGRAPVSQEKLQEITSGVSRSRSSMAAVVVAVLVGVVFSM
ncbi:PLC-like phosphodiesterase [Polyplosphaeria fusca]|uniref:PLC-like phosphodiesterase n=1 Tax=Polyplosphaeria fusca TaxID=682080 RepID=A0A9P4QJA3_9PLEO|nr:PLC-like phosphodiesterase [Polyplosphaeria fusca]